MKFDYSATESFLAYLMGEIKLLEVLQNPAYQTVLSHFSFFQGANLREEDIILALNGQPSPFYGLNNILENIPAIKGLLCTIRQHESNWLVEIKKAMNRLLPNEDASQITIYPIIGYDAGIGHKDNVCLNLNMSFHFKNPLEFLYLAIHECFHVLYEHIHSFPSFSDLKVINNRIKFFHFLTHNEGYAVYAPLYLRQKYGHMGEFSHPILKDYEILVDKSSIKNLINQYDDFVEKLCENQTMTLEDYLNEAFGTKRYPYRIGCTLVNLIEEKYGISEVQKAVYLNGSDFIKKYNHLLSSCKF